jgi:hypothetical protein
MSVLLVMLNLVSLLELPPNTTANDVMLLARLVCSEAGYDKAEGKRVMRVVYNRSKVKKTTVMEEATRPGQFYYKNCTGKRANWIKWHHIELAIETLRGSIVAEPVLNTHTVTYFGTTKRLNQQHSRCRGYTIREVWYWYGLRKVLTSEVGHEFYRKSKGSAGCPNTKSTSG